MWNGFEELEEFCSWSWRNEKMAVQWVSPRRAQKSNCYLHSRNTRNTQSRRFHADHSWTNHWQIIPPHAEQKNAHALASLKSSEGFQAWHQQTYMASQSNLSSYNFSCRETILFCRYWPKINSFIKIKMYLKQRKRQQNNKQITTKIELRRTLLAHSLRQLSSAFFARSLDTNITTFQLSLQQLSILTRLQSLQLEQLQQTLTAPPLLLPCRVTPCVLHPGSLAH